MGLDLVCDCGSRGARVGSYSTVHRVRVMFIRAEAMAQEDEELASKMRAVALTDEKVDYTAFQGISNWSDGTKAFVNHSDCDGEWSYHEIRGILDAVKALRSFMMELCPNYFYEEDDEFYLEDFFRHCVERKECVLFC